MKRKHFCAFWLILKMGQIGCVVAAISSGRIVAGLALAVAALFLGLLASEAEILHRFGVGA